MKLTKVALKTFSWHLQHLLLTTATIVQAIAYAASQGAKVVNMSVETAVKAGLVKGCGNRTFRPKDTLTREQLATMAVRLVSKTVLPVESVELPFTDRAAISPWAREAVASAYAKGLVQGVSGTLFAPKEQVTRAQAATLLARLAARMELFETTVTVL